MIIALYGVPVELIQPFQDKAGALHDNWKSCLCANRGALRESLNDLPVGIKEIRHPVLGIVFPFVYIKASWMESDDCKAPREIPAYAFDLLFLPSSHLQSESKSWAGMIRAFVRDAGITGTAPVGWYFVSERMGKTVPLQTEDDFDEDNDPIILEKPKREEPKSKPRPAGWVKLD